MTTNESTNEIHILMVRDTDQIVGAVSGTEDEANAVAEVMNRGRYSSESIIVKTTDVIRLG